MAKLDSLIVDLQVNTAELRKGLDEANSRLKEFDEKLKELAGVVEFAELGKMALEAAEALGEFALHGAEVAEQAGKMAAAAGTSVESFSKLSYAAKLNGVSTEDFSAAMSKLNVNIAEAAAGSAKQAALFAALGVSVKDASGQVRPLEQVMGDLSDKLASLGDGASKIDLVKGLMGKGGPQLVQFLNETSAGLQEAGEKAERLGLIISSNTAHAAKEFNDNLITMRAAVDGVAVRVAGNLAPAMKNLTDELLNSKDGAQALKDLADVLTGALRVLTTGAVAVATAFKIFGETLAHNLSALVNAAHGNFAEAFEDLKGSVTDAISAISDAGTKIQAIWSTSTKETEKLGEATKGSADKVVASWKAGELAATNYKETIKELNKMIEEEQAKVASFGLGPVDQLVAKLDSGALSHGLKNLTTQFGEAGDKARELVELTQQLHDKSLAKLSIDLNFKIGAEIDATLRDIAQRAQGFSNVGLDQREQIQQFVDQSGVKSFNDALANLAEQTDLHTRKLAEVESLKADYDFEGAQRAQQAADIAQVGIDNAKKVADGFQKLAELDYAQWRGNIDKAISTFASLGEQLASKLGDLGSTISDTVAGFKSGGIYGAIAAFALNLFEHFKRFDELTQFGTQQLQNLVSTLSGPLNDLTDNFKLFMVAMGGMTKIVSDFIGPPMKEFGRLLGDVSRLLTPLFGIIDAILQPLTAMQTALGALLDVIDPLSFALGVLAYVTNGIALVFDIVAQAIESALADFLNGISNFLADLHLDDMAKSISAAAVSLANGADTLQAQIDRLKNNLSDPFATGNNSINNVDSGTYMFAQLNETTQYMQVQLTGVGDSAKNASDQLSKFAKQLDFGNVPTGWKYNLRAYQAMQESGQMPNVSSLRTPNVTIQLAGVVGMTVEQLVGLVIDGMNAQAFRNSGAPPISTNPHSPHF